jgi:hypothetical protein
MQLRRDLAVDLTSLAAPNAKPGIILSRATGLFPLFPCRAAMAATISARGVRFTNLQFGPPQGPTSLRGRTRLRHLAGGAIPRQVAAPDHRRHDTIARNIDPDFLDALKTKFATSLRLGNRQ